MPIGITSRVRVKSNEDSPMVVRGQIAASTTIGENDILIFSDSSGYVAQAAAAGNNIAAAGANVRLCIPHELVDVAKTAGTGVRVRQVTGETLLILPLSNDDAAAAWSAAYRGKRYELRRCTTTGYYTVNINATTNAKVEIVDVVEETKNDTCAYVICRPIPGGAWAGY